VLIAFADCLSMSGVEEKWFDVAVKEVAGHIASDCCLAGTNEVQILLALVSSNLVANVE
jgi:hypothetical protein